MTTWTCTCGRQLHSSIEKCPSCGRMQPTQGRTITGRLFPSAPNLQNIPVRMGATTTLPNTTGRAQEARALRDALRVAFEQTYRSSGADGECWSGPASGNDFEGGGEP